MPATSLINGARAKVSIVDPNTGKTETIGSFNHVDVSGGFDVQTAYGLGNFEPQAADIVAVNAVSLNVRGWRPVDHGPYADGHMPTTQTLLSTQYLEFDVLDRQLEEAGRPDARVGIARWVRPATWNQSFGDRELSSQAFTYVALRYDTEGVENHETDSASHIP